MITREKIKRFVEANGVEDIMERVWGVNHTVEPKLLAGGPEGDGCRLGLAAHVVKTFFAAQMAEKTADEVFGIFCERFCASEQDVIAAFEQTRQDLETSDVATQDVAVTLIWLWFVDAARRHGDYSLEIKFFLYSLADMSRGNPRLRWLGIRKFASEVAETPTLFDRLVNFVFGR